MVLFLVKRRKKNSSNKKLDPCLKIPINVDPILERNIAVSSTKIHLEQSNLF